MSQLEAFKEKRGQMVCRIVDHNTYDWLDRPIPKPWPPSLTVPDMVMPLEEVIRRFTRNQAVPIMDVQYSEADMSDYSGLDVFERIDMKRKIDARVRDLRVSIELEQRRAAEQHEKERFDRAVQDAILKQTKTTI